MEPTDIYSVEFIEGVMGSPRRRVVLLTSDTDKLVDAVGTLTALGRDHAKAERDLFSRFDRWTNGHNNKPDWSHGWDENEFKHCYVFKWKVKKVGHRLYGFLYHPKPLTDKRFQVCALAYHATKTEFSTDKSILRRAMALHGNGQVWKALAVAFPDKN